MYPSQLMNFNNSRELEDVYSHYLHYDEENNVFNGIAYIPERDSFLMTGKMWNHMHEVKLDYRKYILTT